MPETKTEIYTPSATPHKDDLDKKVVQRCLRTIRDFEEILQWHREEWDILRDQNDNSYYAGPQEDPSVYIHSKVVGNYVKKVREKHSLPEWYPKFATDVFFEEMARFKLQIGELQKSGQKVDQEFIQRKVAEITKRYETDLAEIKAGMEYVLDKSNYKNAFLSADGAFNDVDLIGNSYVTTGVTDNEVSPVQVFSFLPDKVYVNRDARVMRNSGQGRNVTRMAMVFDVSYDYFRSKVVPNLSKKAQKEAEKIMWGNLPTLQEYIQGDRDKYYVGDNVQEMSMMGQYCIYYDLELKTKAIIAGSGAVVLEEFEGDNYPHQLNGEDVINVIHLIGHPKSRGFLGVGPGHYSSEIHSVDEQRLNNHVISEFNAGNPLYMFDSGEASEEEMEMRMREAEARRAEGMIGFIPKKGNVSIDTIAPRLIETDTFLDNKFSEMAIHYGLNLSDVDTEASKKLGQVELEFAAQSSLPQQTSENNSAEIKFFLEMIIQECKKISKNNKTPIPTESVQISRDQAPIKVSGMKLGKLPKLLEKYDVMITIDPQSGITPNNRERKARLERAIGLSQGRPVQDELVKELFREDGLFFDEETFKPLEAQQV